METHSTRTFIASVEDRPGVLNRIVSLFRRRGYNIVSLTVGRTHESGISRLTLVTEADADMAGRIQANLYKLVNVLYVEDISQTDSVVRDLALIKVSATVETRPHVLQLCEVFRARVVDMGVDSLSMEVTGTPDKLDGFLEVLRPFGILEMVSTGAVAMTRGARRVPGVPGPTAFPRPPAESMPSGDDAERFAVESA